MLKKLGALIMGITLSSVALAETCPDVASIKAGNFDGWQALNANSDNPASKNDIDIFKKQIQDFYQAEWSEDFEGNGHCYYTGYLEVLLAKDTPAPKISAHWQDLGIVLRCKSGSVKVCEF